MGKETRINEDSLGEVNRLAKILSNGHFVTSARNDTWVIVVTHQGAIIVGKLAI